MSTFTNANTLNPSDIETFLQELATRFEADNEIDDVLGPVVRHLLFHQSLWRPEGLGGGDASWRGVVSGPEALVSIKSIAVMITRMPEWIPANATAATFEKVTLLGPLLRLGVFAREWVGSSRDSSFLHDSTLFRSRLLPKHTSQTLKSVLEQTLILQMLVLEGP